MKVFYNPMEIEKQIKSFLNKIVQDKPWHTRWLNTLAFMEHIGSRKIIKSQDSTHLNITVLQHISEEARHAFYFKNLAHRLSPEDCPTFEEDYLINGEASEFYFQSIDHKAEEDLSHSPCKKLLNYLYTTWMIEERAIMLYEIYNQILKQYSFSFNLNFILREEDHHLKTVTEMIQKTDQDYQKRTERLFEYENASFTKLIKEWEAAVSLSIPAPSYLKTKKTPLSYSDKK